MKKGIVIGQVSSKGVKEVRQVLFSKDDYIDIAEVEENTEEDIKRYEEYKKARNERVKAKFKGSER